MAIRTFLQKHPYTRIVDTDPETGNKIHKVRLADPVPDGLNDRAVEIGEGLRAALDGAAFASAQATGNTRLKGTYFPISDTAAQLETDVIERGNCRDLPAEIVALFRSFKPYKDGNYLVWAMNKLANGTKHRILMPVGMATSGDGVLRNFECDGMVVEMGFPPRWDPENDEIILGIFGADAKVQYDMSLAILVALRPFPETRRQPATDVFNAAAREVERIVMATEAETARILSGRS